MALECYFLFTREKERGKSNLGVCVCVSISSLPGWTLVGREDSGATQVCSGPNQVIRGTQTDRRVVIPNGLLPPNLALILASPWRNLC